MKITAYSERGSNKAECQDKILVGDTILSEGFYELEKKEKPLVAAVSDGVGGNPAGEVAAMMAVDGMRRLNRVYNCDEAAIRAQMCAANREIIRASREDENRRNMAATLTGIYFYPERDAFFHVGNTRIMVYASGMLTQVTEDQTTTVVDEYGRERHFNTGGMGNGEECFLNDYIEVNRENFNLDNGVILLLTSDGIHDFVETAEAERLLADAVSAPPGWEKDFCLRLAARAREEGSVDDISILLIHERKQTEPAGQEESKQ